jgi:surfeit locus 1 family protein
MFLQLTLYIHGLTCVFSLDILPEFVYRKVVLSGTWDHAHSMLIGPRVREGTHGLHLITPLIRKDGTTVLVDRGFVKKDMGEVAKSIPVEGNVEVVGMIRTSQSRNAFTPDNDPQKGIWYWADVDTMVQYAGGESANVQPVFIEAIFGEDSPSYMTTEV